LGYEPKDRAERHDICRYTREVGQSTSVNRIEGTMPARVLLFAIFFLISASAGAQTDTGPAPDISAIRHLIDQYAKAIDTVDPHLISQIWSHSPEVSFIYPLGEERGFDAIEQHVFEGVMGGYVQCTRS